MRIDILTIFPGMFAPLEESIIQRARDRELLDIVLWNVRDFSRDKHHKVDDAPYGGGRGMVIACDPVFRAVRAIRRRNPKARVVLTNPQGRLFTQAYAREMSREKGLIFICGHYEGMDERISSLCDDEVSIGDYVLTGGELPAMVMVDCIARLIPGVLPADAPVNESFSSLLLDWPSYTRPAVFRRKKVPDVLLSGDHERIGRWRREVSVERTKERRPDLYEKYLQALHKEEEPNHQQRKPGKRSHP